MYNNFKERIKVLSEIVQTTRQVIMSEEHTKMAYIVPFLTNLGFDMSNPVEVVPEYTCDFGTKRGEKVDYALFVNSQPYIIVEAKDCKNELSSKNVSQLFRYFSVCSARLAVLSNGVDYWFFTDSEEPNKMDKEPFFKFNFINYTDDDLKMLFRFHKTNCSKEDALSFLKVQKIEDELLKWFKAQSVQPSLKFINFLKKNVAGIGIQGADITTALKNVLGVLTDDTYVEVQDNEVSLEMSTVYEDNDTDDKVEKVLVRKNMVGITIYGTINEVFEQEIAGSKVVGVVFEETGNEYECASFPDLFSCLILEMQNCGFSIEELISCDDSTDYDVFRLDRTGLRVAGECSGIYYEKNLSAKDTFKRFIHLCNCLCLETDTIKVGLCNREDYRKYISDGMTDSDILKAIMRG